MQLNKIIALIKLIDDPDDNIYLKVKENIIKQGTEIIPELKKALRKSKSTTFNKRVKKIIKQIYFIDLKKEFLNWAKSENKDIFSGLILLTKYQKPNLKPETIFDKTNIILNDIRIELNIYLTALQQVRIINNIFFGIHGFIGNFNDIKNPNNFFLDKVISSKKGNDITLAVLYKYIAQQSGLNLQGVDFPRNFLLAFVDDRNTKTVSKHNILFYVNPFNKGAIITTNDVNAFLEKNKIKKEDKYYLPCSNIEIMQRTLLFLIKIYKENKKPGKAKNIKKLLKIITKANRKPKK